MKSSISRALRAAVIIVCAAIAASCDSSPVAVDSTYEAAARPARFDASPNQVDMGSTATTATVTLQSAFDKSV
ncbi:MAG TPA: hypothetical protein VJ982_13125, partial [Gemmatimonadota bacterium]|nr:hypothetical protein [Gemmatimonadota bacterium]